MTDDQTPAEEAGDEVVQTEVEQTEAAEAPESTEGQDNDLTAEDDTANDAEESEDDKLSRNQRRRANRKAEKERLLAEKRDADEALRRANDEIERLKQGQADTPPRVEDFENYDEYLAERSAYASMQRLDERQMQNLEREAEARRQDQQRLSQEQMRQAEENWQALKSEATERYADFEAVTTAKDLTITEGMGLFIMQSDRGADIAYHLGMNKEQARRIADLPADQQAGAMAAVEMLLPGVKPRPRTQTSAPPPVTPVKAKATASKDPAKMTSQEYRQWREDGGTL